MANAKVTQRAIEICLHLEANGGYLTTNSLFEELNIGAAQSCFARKVLNRLYRVGSLNRYGKGKYRWAIQSGWNRSNPFRAPSTSSSTSNEKDPNMSMSTAKAKPVHGMLRTSKFENPCCRNCGEVIRIGSSIMYSETHGTWIHESCTAPSGGVEPKPVSKVEPSGASNALVQALAAEVAKLSKQVSELETTRKVEITVTQPDKSTVKLTERVHPLFEKVMFHLSVGDNVMLVGPKGCGKTTLCEQVAKALKREFSLISLSGGTTEAKLFGRNTPNITTGKNEFHSTEFTDMWENGGVFLLDEVDAGDPNVLLSLNSALANNALTLDRAKNRKPARHEDNVILAAANTFGNGADRTYVGRNQQDGAFSERFVPLAMDYDGALELSLCPGREDMVRKLQGYRENINKHRMERTISTRVICRAAKWMNAGKDMQYVEELIFAGWREDEIRKAKGF